MDTDCLKPIAEGDTQELLKHAAGGELLLYVALHPFTAKLQAQNWAKEPKQSEWTNNTGEYVPLNPGAAKGLCMFPDAQVAWFEPDGSWEESHPWHDHVWFLDKPQTVTREQVYFVSSAKPEPSTERTEAQQRQVNLIEKVRELMQRELDTTWPDGQRGLKMHVIKHHYPELQRIYSHDATAETMAGKTKPSACKNLGVPQLPT